MLRLAQTDRQRDRQTEKQIKTAVWLPKERVMGETENSQGNSVINYSEYVYMEPSSDQSKVEISLLFHHDWSSHVCPFSASMCTVHTHTHTCTNTEQFSSSRQPPSPYSHLHLWPKADYNITSVDVSLTCTDTLPLCVTVSSHTVCQQQNQSCRFYRSFATHIEGRKNKWGTNRAFLGFKQRPTDTLTANHFDSTEAFWMIHYSLFGCFSVFWLDWSAKLFLFLRFWNFFVAYGRILFQFTQ